MWIALAVAVALAGLWTLMARRQRRRQIGPRQPRPVGELARELADSAGIPEAFAAQVLDDVGVALDINPSYLRVDDRFGGVLRAPSGWEYDDGLGLLLEQIVQQAHRFGVSPSPLETLTDYARLSYRLQSGPGERTAKE